MTRFASYILSLASILPLKSFSQVDRQEITIGLLLPDQSHSDIIPAAELAIEEANRAGGYLDRDFRLKVRTAEGFWGAGSKESVSLVYEDDVRAIIGYLDGRNGHLAEQVAAKSHLSYIETYATEATLSQAYVPWFMRVVPNDNQQSLALVKQMLREGGGKAVILSNGTYDCDHAVKSLTRAMAGESGISPAVIPMDPEKIDLGEITERILLRDPDHLLIPFDAPFLRTLIGYLQEEKKGLKIYGMLHFSFGAERRKEEWKSYEGLFVLGPLYGGGDKGAPGNSQAAFLYDAMNLVINAIRQVGTDREIIAGFISGSTYSSGATGSICFDDLGNRKDAARLYRIINGIPQAIE